MPVIDFVCETLSGRSDRVMSIERLVVAGWTGRDRDRMEEHMAELEALGIKRPPRVPVFYRASASRLTTEPQIEVIAGTSSGEVEVLLVQDDHTLWVGLASDHTDRGVEAYDITVSKQMCDKPCAPTLWAFDDVAAHWNQLVLRSHIEEDGSKRLYQEGSLAAMLQPHELIERYRSAGGGFGPATAMLCGTPPARGGVRGSALFEMELFDPVLDRTLGHAYRVLEIPPEE